MCDYESASLNEILTLLRGWRESNKRASEDVVEMWQTTLSSNINRLGKEKHVLLEQVIFAALDCHRFDVSNKCIEILNDEFPDSLRVRRYLALQAEAGEKYDHALEVLDSLIERDETNAAPRKRKVAIYKARGRIPEAIKELTEYLKKFMSDVEAWQELCDLYLSQSEYAKAVFCAEELLLHQPHSHLFYQRVADIRYTMGGIENLELAKTYYCQAVHLNPTNMRALLGLYLVCNNLISQYKSGGGNNKKKSSQYCSVQGAWALKCIKARYQSLGQNIPSLEGPEEPEKQTDPVKGIVDSLSALSVA